MYVLQGLVTFTSLPISY